MEVWVLNFMIEISVDTLNSFSDQKECCFFFKLGLTMTEATLQVHKKISVVGISFSEVTRQEPAILEKFQ